jgi:fructokinase
MKVACFGEILWDIFQTGPSTFRRVLGGAPANVATGLARLGVDAGVVGGVGRDSFGDALLAHLAKDQVDTRFVKRLPNRTGVTFVTRDAHGEPSFLFYRHDSADMAMKATDAKPRLGPGAWALVGTSTLMSRELSAATFAFLRAARAGGASIFVDLNVRAHLWSSRAHMDAQIARVAAYADILKASDADLSAVAGKGGRRWLTETAPKATWLLTHGARGATAVGVHGEVFAKARRAKCVDATGAGDAFIAGTLAALLAADAHPASAAWRDARKWAAAIEVGHIVGAKAVSRIGAVEGLVALGGARQKLRAIRGTRGDTR